LCADALPADYPLPVDEDASSCRARRGRISGRVPVSDTVARPRRKCDRHRAAESPSGFGAWLPGPRPGVRHRHERRTASWRKAEAPLRRETLGQVLQGQRVPILDRAVAAVEELEEDVGDPDLL